MSWQGCELALWVLPVGNRAYVEVCMGA